MINWLVAMLGSLFGTETKTCCYRCGLFFPVRHCHTKPPMAGYEMIRYFCPGCHKP